MRKSIGVSKAHAKVILGGEHSVVHGHPAIAMPMPLTVNTIARLTETEFSLSTNLIKGSESQSPNALEGYFQMLRFLKKSLKETRNSAISVYSKIPVASGLGSSAAVAHAIAKSYMALLGVKDDTPLIFEAVHIAETYAHGNASGLDMLATHHESPIVFQKKDHDRAIKILSLGDVFHFVVALTGIAVSTKVVVEKVNGAMAKEPFKKNALMARFSEVVKQMEGHLSNGDALGLGGAMLENQTYLQQLGVSSDPLEHLINAAMRSGALGAKLTGKGVGGAVIALCKDEEHSAYVLQQLLKSGAVDGYAFQLDNRMNGGLS